MRYLRVIAILLFVVSILFSAWANLRHYSKIDTDIPTISSDTELLEVSVHDKEEALLQGLTAQDATDGDLTDQIMVSSVSHFIEENVVNVKYVVFDENHNAASFTRKVRYTDYESPRFSMEKSAVFTRGSNFDLLSRINVTDCLDGDISQKIRVISNSVNVYAAGVYPVTLEVTNSLGDVSQLTVLVTILEEENTATIKLNQYIVYAEQNESFDPYRYVSAVADLTGKILTREDVQVKGSVDTTTPGTYRLEYFYNDGTLSAQTALLVVVEGEEGAS